MKIVAHGKTDQNYGITSLRYYANDSVRNNLLLKKKYGQNKISREEMKSNLLLNRC